MRKKDSGKRTSYIWHYGSPLGRMTLASDGEALTGCWFDGQVHFGSTLEAEVEKKELPVFRKAALWLTTYFSGDQPQKSPRLFPRGTPFQCAVWNALHMIPYGQTTTYGAIAEQLRTSGFPKVSPRAVGGAVGRNPILLLIPCHRVLGAGRQLTGYAAGVERKEKLLALEKKS